MSGSAEAGTTAERHTCELQVLAGSAVRAPPKRASGESFSLDKAIRKLSQRPVVTNGHRIGYSPSCKGRFYEFF